MKRNTSTPVAQPATFGSSISLSGNTNISINHVVVTVNGVSAFVFSYSIQRFFTETMTSGTEETE